MDSKITMPMAQKLTDLRIAKGATQEIVAEALRLSDATISKWENGVSLPECKYIPDIADYYGVSIDELFGRQKPNIAITDITSAIEKEFEGLSCSESTLKSFEIALQAVSGCLHSYQRSFQINSAAPEDLVTPIPVPPHIVSDIPEAVRTTIANAHVYEVFINSRDTNMTVMLLGNAANFNWLTERAGEFVPVFEFLADEDAAKVCRLFYRKAFPMTFTADFMAKEAGISIDKALSLLEKAISLGLCEKSAAAHIKEGKVDIYAICGNGTTDGMILSILTLAYEYMCGANNNNGAYNGCLKMIREEK